MKPELQNNPLPEDPQEETADIPAQTEQGLAILKEQCSFLLQSSLDGSDLPVITRDRIHRQFADRVFQPATLAAEILAARDEVAALTAPGSIKGIGRLTGMADENDQITAAVDDMLGAPRDAGMEKVKPARLSGIREMYMLMTGDYSLHGGYYPDAAKLATTADFTGLVKNALNKVVARQWESMGRAGYDWWKAIVKVEHFETLNTITGILTGTVGALSTVEE